MTKEYINTFAQLREWAEKSYEFGFKQHREGKGDYWLGYSGMARELMRVLDSKEYISIHEQINSKSGRGKRNGYSKISTSKEGEE